MSWAPKILQTRGLHRQGVHMDKKPLYTNAAQFLQLMDAYRQRAFTVKGLFQTRGPTDKGSYSQGAPTYAV